MTTNGSANGRLAGKNAVVTGAASGLGREVLLGMVREGANVVGFDRDADKGEAVIAEAQALRDSSAILHVGDVTVEDDIVAAIDRCVDEYGSLDVIHNNAGWQAEAPLHETTNEQWDRMVAINLTALFWGCKHAVRSMLGNGGGSIINTGSILSFTADEMIAAYCATKAGVVGLTRATAIAYVAQGIRCNAVCPGDMDTPLTQGYFASTDDPAGSRKELEDASPIKRLADPAEVASAVLYLASDDASFVNGAALVVDGGLTVKTY